MNRTIPLIASLLIAAAATADDAADKKLLKSLEGSFTAVSMTRSGEAAPADFLKTVSLAVKGDTFVISFAKETKEATVVIDADAKPASIDLTPKAGPDVGKPMLGIVKIEGDMVTLCWADLTDKGDRPKEFSSTDKNKHFLVVMKKSK